MQYWSGGTQSGSGTSLPQFLDVGATTANRIRVFMAYNLLEERLVWDTSGTFPVGNIESTPGEEVSLIWRIDDGSALSYVLDNADNPGTGLVLIMNTQLAALPGVVLSDPAYSIVYTHETSGGSPITVPTPANPNLLLRFFSARTSGEFPEIDGFTTIFPIRSADRMIGSAHPEGEIADLSLTFSTATPSTSLDVSVWDFNFAAPDPVIDALSSVATIDHDLVVGAGPDDHHAEAHALVGPDHLEGFFTKSGVSPTITDADFATTPEDGMPAMTIDTSTGIKLMWVRANSTWDAVEVVA